MDGVFYEWLGDQISTLEQTGTLSLFPTFLEPRSSNIETVAFRLGRRGRLEKVRKFRLVPCTLENDDKETSLSILETLLETCPNLTEFTYEEKSSDNSWQTNDIGRLIHACPRLQKLTIDTGLRRLEDPSTLLSSLRLPTLLKDLDIEFVGYEQDQFCHALARCDQLESLKMGTKDASPKYFANLMGTIIAHLPKLHNLRIRYWGHESFSGDTTKLFSKLVRTKRLRHFHLHSIMNHAEGKGAFVKNTPESQALMQALYDCDSLEQLHLIGDLGFTENSIRNIFTIMETKRSMKSLSLDQRNLSLSREGWDSILQSICVNKSIEGVQICTGSHFCFNFLPRIVEALKGNMTIAHFAVRSQDMNECSCTYGPLGDLARRNEYIKLARTRAVLNDDNFPESLLPLALSRLQTDTADRSAVFTALRNVSGIFTTVGKRQQPQPAKRTRPRRKCTIQLS